MYIKLNSLVVLLFATSLLHGKSETRNEYMKNLESTQSAILSQVEEIKGRLDGAPGWMTCILNGTDRLISGYFILEFLSGENSFSKNSNENCVKELLGLSACINGFLALQNKRKRKRSIAKALAMTALFMTISNGKKGSNENFLLPLAQGSVAIKIGCDIAAVLYSTAGGLLQGIAY